MPVVPEFILRRMFVQNSLRPTKDGFSFSLKNTFAPASLYAFRIEIDGQPVPPENLTIRIADGEESLKGSQITKENAFPLSINKQVDVAVTGFSPGKGNLKIQVETREAGLLAFSIKAEESGKAKNLKKRSSLLNPFNKPYKVESTVYAEESPGKINPWIYGQFIEHLERCIYGGIWDENGDQLRPDTLELIKAIQPPIMRYPGGNFASGYHWEDGIGSKDSRPKRFDNAWKSWDSNRVGTDEYMAFCMEVGCEPFLVVNDGSGTPEEAARWVAYCNEDASGPQGSIRAANGHPEPYNVRVWGIGNEVWGDWQIGHTGAEEYAARLVQFARAMRAVDPNLYLVAVGDKILSDNPHDSGRLWNDAVLHASWDLIDAISFHLYQPEQEGWRDSYDPAMLHAIVCAAPLAAEKIIERMADQIAHLVPSKKIDVVFDEWNLWLPPPEGAASMHQVVYSMRDALYLAGMLNVFHRQSRSLSMANLAQMVNILPLIVTNENQAYPTPPYYSFLLYRQMESMALKTKVLGAYYDSPALGNIPAFKDVPYLDLSATINAEQNRLVIGIVNRHPDKRVDLRIKLSGFGKMTTSQAWLLTNPDPLAVNSFAEPQKVKSKSINLPSRTSDHFRLDIPPSALAIFVATK
jgi:alpha-L-arabinofuranosidase